MSIQDKSVEMKCWPVFACGWEWKKGPEKLKVTYVLGAPVVENWKKQVTEQKLCSQLSQEH